MSGSAVVTQRTATCTLPVSSTVARTAMRLLFCHVHYALSSVGDHVLTHNRADALHNHSQPLVSEKGKIFLVLVQFATWC